jgi:hypothetical protein
MEGLWGYKNKYYIVFICLKIWDGVPKPHAQKETPLNDLLQS